MNRLALTILLALGTCSTGCISATLDRQRILKEPVGVHSLTAGESDLEECLDVLGAPLVVRENGDGAWLAWGWAQRGGWTTTASIPVTDSNTISLQYGRRLDGLEGAVLFFDGAWTLQAVRRGYLTEILPSSQVRAQLVE